MADPLPVRHEVSVFMIATADSLDHAIDHTTDLTAVRRDQLTERLFEATVGAFDLLAIYLGERLGLYRALANGVWTTPGELARRSGLDERYVREWLEHQAVGAVIDCDNPDAEADERRYRLPAGHAEVLVDPESPWLMSPMARFVVSSAQRMPDLLEAYRTGDGVSWERYGRDMLEAQAAINRPVLMRELSSWVASMPDVEARLRQPGARIADVACGAGWSTIALARAYPHAQVVGIDLDVASIELARRNLAVSAPDVADRVTFLAVDAASAGLDGQFDLVTIVEAVHDMSRPEAVLAEVRRLLAPGGAALVIDERVAETFTAPGDPTERLMYGYSVMICLANSRVDGDSRATGTVLRPHTVREIASEAGFERVTVLPVEHDTFRLYRLDA